MRALNSEELSRVGGGCGFSNNLFDYASGYSSKVIGKGAVGAITGGFAAGPFGAAAGYLIGTGMGNLIDMQYNMANEGRDSKRVENYDYGN